MMAISREQRRNLKTGMDKLFHPVTDPSFDDVIRAIRLRKKTEERRSRH